MVEDTAGATTAEERASAEPWLARLREAGDAAPSPRSAATRPVARPLRAAGALLAEETNPLEIMEIRLALEPALARLAALRATPADIACILRTATTPVGADFTAADLAFHTAVADGARNGLAASLYGVLRQIAEAERDRLPAGVRDAFAGERIAARDAEHRRVAEAIAARDPDAAEAAMRAHLSSVSRTMTAQLAARG